MIRLILYIFCFLSLSVSVLAQQDTTLVFSRPGYLKDPLRSKLKPIITQEGGMYVLSLYDKKSILQEKITFADKDLKVREGAYQLFENGILVAEGMYNKGYKVKEWSYYYPNKQLYERINYAWDKRNGIYNRYWDNGAIKEVANYNIGERTGERIMYYKSGIVALREKYENGKLIAGTYQDVDGKPVNELFVMQPPSYPGGLKAFYQYLGSAIRYPSGAVKNGVAGTVKVSFTVMKDGSLEDIKAIESADPELAMEAVRVVSKSSNWIPGKELGEPVKVHYVVPIKFSLPGGF